MQPDPLPSLPSIPDVQPPPISRTVLWWMGAALAITAGLSAHLAQEGSQLAALAPFRAYLGLVSAALAAVLAFTGDRSLSARTGAILLVFGLGLVSGQAGAASSPPIDAPMTVRGALAGEVDPLTLLTGGFRFCTGMAYSRATGPLPIAGGCYDLPIAEIVPRWGGPLETLSLSIGVGGSAQLIPGLTTSGAAWMGLATRLSPRSWGYVASASLVGVLQPDPASGRITPIGGLVFSFGTSARPAPPSPPPSLAELTRHPFGDGSPTSNASTTFHSRSTINVIHRTMEFREPTGNDLPREPAILAE